MWALLGLLLAAPLSAQIPRLQAIPLPDHEISFQLSERELVRYHFAPDLPRPFLYPVIGPSGRTLTRMGHPGDPDTHSHHNSVWFSLSNVNGGDFWSDRGGGRIRHRRTLRLADGDEVALAVTEADWIAKDGTPLLRETRKVFVKPLANRGEYLLALDLTLAAQAAPVRLEKNNFGPIGVRMAKWISAHFGGGRIRNSEGAEGERAIFRKPARWVDYSGPVASGVVEGIALLDHPGNPRSPAPFHVREDGWMGAMLALDEAYTIERDTPLHLRYGLYVHAGAPPLSAIDAVWKRFAEEPLPPPFGPPKTARDCLHGDHRRFTVPRTFRSQQDCEAYLTTGR
jgi:hypothetical protein